MEEESRSEPADEPEPRIEEPSSASERVAQFYEQIEGDAE